MKDGLFCLHTAVNPEQTPQLTEDLELDFYAILPLSILFIL